MQRQFLSIQGHMRALITRILVLLAFSTSSIPALPSQQGPSPLLVIEAPANVEVGDTIEIQLIVEHAHDLAGYEGQLLFDATAAHFSGLHQRDSDLRKFGRDVIPLEVTELPDGIAMGLASCPYSACVEMKGNPQPRGANGRVRLGTVLIGTDQEGLLELFFEHLKFVDASGNQIAVDIPQTRIYVQVGSDNGVRFPAPVSTWELSPSAGTAGDLDITGEGLVDYADAMEGALEWTLGREQGQPCGPANDLSRDVNGDGCIDVVDIQTILANTSAGGPRTHFPNPSNPKEAGSTAAPDAQAATALVFTVNSTSDADDSNIGDGVCASGSGCTLRAAIEEANRHFGPDTILFNIPGDGLKTIQLGSRLPSLFDGSGGTTIDGYSQSGAQANTDGLVSNAQIMIEIRGNGPSAFDAFAIQSAGNVIRGLAIFNGKRGIYFLGSGSRNNLLVGNFIGTNAAGTFGHTVHTLHASGVDMDTGANNNQVGGTSPADRNVVSGNARHGINFNSEATDNNAVYNNLIGTNPSGTGRLQNLRHGIDMNSGPSYNIVGGTGPGQRNILSGNGENQDEAFAAGIEISHDALTSFNQVIGNCIGTDPTCNTGPSWTINRHYGIRIEDRVNNNTVADNVIGNNPHGGIRITGSSTNRNQIYNNRIGISLNNTAIPNGSFGIQIARSSKFNQIGPGNIITNSPVGVQVLDTGTDQHRITQNSIFDNTRLGIDLGPTSGVTQNDSSDSDADANEGLNWPVLTSATPSQVTGTACAQAAVSKPCTVEIFIAERLTSDSGGGSYGQGRTYVSSGTTNSDGSFAVAITGVTAGQYLTATARDAAGNTSEFALNIIVSGGGSTPTPTPTSQPSTPTPTPTGQPPTSTPSGNTTYASDSFTRTITNGWGSADTGGSYTLTGTASNFNVNGSEGMMVVTTAGGARVARLQNTSVQDLGFLFRVKTDKLAAGSNQSAFFIARGVTTNTEYRAQLRISTSGTMYIRAAQVVSGTQTLLGTEVAVPGVTHTANSYIWVRGEVVGTNPTTIRLKAWADGQAEPASWQYTVTDSTSSLQTGGAVGLRAFLPSGVTNAPVVFTFDDLLVSPP
jgi:CSLREA domain-containing protein